MDERPAGDPLARYRPLQAVSILLIVAGLAAIALVSWSYLGLLTGGQPLPTQGEAINALVGVLLGGVSLSAGLVANAVRAVIVREALPPQRYRGPSIIVLLMLATVVAGVGSIAVAGEVAALQEGGDLSPLASLLVLTVTQLGMLAVAAVFVAAPHGLVGVRLLPERGVARSILLGLALAVPAWIAAQLVGVAASLLLQQLGMTQEVGLAEQAVERVDPAVLVIALVIVAPIAEEIFFRGIVFNAWEREYGPRWAVYGSAALFALIHQSAFLLLPIFLLGLLLATVYRRTRSLPAVIALHAGFNGITVLLGLLVRFDVIRLPQ